MNDAFGFPQSAVVIGGTSDIALAIAAELVPRGCRHVVLAGRDLTRLSTAAHGLRSLGAATVVEVQCEARDLSTVDQLVKTCTEAAPGGIDLVLVAVGQLGEQASDEADSQRTAEMIGVNFGYPAAVLAGLAEQLRHQGHGRIVVLSSVAGVRVRRSNFLYGATKAGLDAYAVGLTAALEGSGVKVHVVRPGFVRSKMTEGLAPAPFARTLEAVARDVVRGLEHDQAVIWSPPILRFVFGVLQALPKAIWRKLPG
jgi:decaprenylphospho-beta-D-erythro-pentofuranosid-2-ulose 2-reductase